MRRRNMLAVVLAALAALTLSACGSGGAAAAGTAAGNAGTTTSAEPDTHLTAESNKRIMQRWTTEFLPHGDAALAEELISPDIVMNFAGQQQQGRDTYLGLVAANSAAFPDLRWTVEDMVAEGDTVAVRYSMTGTHQGTFAGIAATGRAVHSESITFYRLADGKIVEEHAQLDMLGLLQQMGAVPSS
jgi:steroid delta-isomerase-like uncharacterized protein